MTKQTLLDYLFEKLDERTKYIDGKSGNSFFLLSFEDVMELFNKSKEIEKEQIISAYFAGYLEGKHMDHIKLNGAVTPKDTKAEIYYSILSRPI